MRRSWALPAMVALLGLVLVGCADAEPESPEASPRTTASSPIQEPTTQEPVQEPVPEPSPPAVPPDLSQQLIGLADAEGYGPADEEFVLVMVAQCERVAEGSTSFARLIEEDVAVGAPRASAERFHGFMRDEFCPAL